MVTLLRLPELLLAPVSLLLIPLCCGRLCGGGWLRCLPCGCLSSHHGDGRWLVFCTGGCGADRVHASNCQLHTYFPASPTNSVSYHCGRPSTPRTIIPTVICTHTFQRPPPTQYPTIVEDPQHRAPSFQMSLAHQARSTVCDCCIPHHIPISGDANHITISH
jgi:hypothetical protein